MAIPIIMPKQGQSVESCIITEWHKAVGDEVKVGDLLFSYETDKASFDEEAKEAGTLLAILFETDDVVPVLENVAVIGKAGESIDEFTSGAESPTEEAAPVVEAVETPVIAPSGAVASVQAPTATSGKLKISPRAKKMAAANGIDANSIAGSGPNGRIIVKDVEPLMGGVVASVSAQAVPAVASVAPSTPTPIESGFDYTTEKLPNIRKVIAERMQASLQNSAQLTHHLSADARKMLAARNQIKAAMKEGSTDNITLNDMVCFAIIKALKQMPEANAHFLGDAIKKFSKVHLGLAVDTERGLMVPTIRNADDFSIQGLSSNIKMIAAQCKEGSIDPALLAAESASFTVSNLGAFGVEMFTPVLNVPQVGIMGVNTIIKRPTDVGDGVIGMVPFIGLSLTYDHRALDGAPASRFLALVKEEIENLDLQLS